MIAQRIRKLVWHSAKIVKNIQHDPDDLEHQRWRQRVRNVTQNQNQNQKNAQRVHTKIARNHDHRRRVPIRLIVQNLNRQSASNAVKLPKKNGIEIFNLFLF